MRRKQEALPEFAIKNPNKIWVSSEIDKIINEWEEWAAFCQNLANGEDSPDFDPQTCSDAIKDGRKNLNKHEILREKTLVFLRNNFTGFEFIFDGWYSHPYESNTNRLNVRTDSWLQRLQILKASMDYVQVPDGFWQEQGKSFLEALSQSTAEGALEVAKSYLKNPLKT